jgi:fatty-acid peroxygenase
VLAALAVRLARLPADLPEQDLDIALHRIPALPASRIRLRVHASSS